MQPDDFDRELNGALESGARLRGAGRGELIRGLCPQCKVARVQRFPHEDPRCFACTPIFGAALAAELADVEQLRRDRLAEIAERERIAQESIARANLRGWANVRACFAYAPTRAVMLGCCALSLACVILAVLAVIR